MIYTGNPASPGYAIGEVLVFQRFTPQPVQRRISTEGVEAEIARYERAREAANAELVRLCGRMRSAGDGDKAKIFSAHREILFDEAMDEDIRLLISEELYGGDWAVAQTYGQYGSMLSRAGRALIRERAADLSDVENRLLRCWAGLPEKNLAVLERPVILAAHDLLPSDTAALDRANVLGIVTETGGAASHSAILARSYGIPALLGASGVLSVLRQGDTVVLDAVSGQLILSPAAEDIARCRGLQAEFLRQGEEAQRYIGRKAVTPDGTAVDIELNIGSTDTQELENSRYADGAGLLRSEFLYMERAQMPTEEEQFDAYRKVLRAFDGRPVTLRTLDIGGDKTLDYLPLPHEDNPFLGKRALRLCFDQSRMFQTQLRAALRASAYGKLQLMFPMVAGMEDFRRAKAMVTEVQLALRAGGVPYDQGIKTGVMIEIPSAALIADILAQEVDFASIGTNDLIQYCMAADRTNPNVSEYYQPYHPAVLRLIRHAAQAFCAAGKSVCVCGEMSGDPLSAGFLVGVGIRRLSMSFAAVPQVKKLICSLPRSVAESAAREACSLATAAEAEACLRQALAPYL